MVYKNQINRAVFYTAVSVAFMTLMYVTTSSFYAVYKHGGIPTIIMLLFSLFSLTFIFCSICFLTLAVSVFLNTTKLIYKNPRTGMFSVPSFLFWSPYILSEYVILFFNRCIFRSKLPVVSEITPSLYLGGLPELPGFDDRILGAMDSVVDVTCDMPQLELHRSYLCIPVWDGISPTAEQIKTAADWIFHEYQARHSVFVHCCYGVGRSATIMVAALVKCGLCSTVAEAYRFVKSKRPFVELGESHMTELAKWMEMERGGNEIHSYFY